VLYVREDLRGHARPLGDVNQLSSDGTVALDWWYPTHDGKYLAYGISKSGSENSTLHVIDCANGKQLSEAIEGTRLPSVAWEDGAGGR
jgi:prolyl oligopeptidase